MLKASLQIVLIKSWVLLAYNILHCKLAAVLRKSLNKCLLDLLNQLTGAAATHVRHIK